MKYTLDHQIKCLEAIGYTVETQTVEESVFYYDKEQLVPRRVKVVKYKGEVMAEYAGYGDNRVIECFTQEYRKRVSQLIFGI